MCILCDSAPALTELKIDIKSASLDQPEVIALITALNADLIERYPEDGSNHFRLDPEEVAPGRGVFLVAYVDGHPAGCGATRLIDPQTAEIKRMYVAPEFRGRGIAGRVLEGLEQHARSLGARQIVLETGERQPEAIALYTRAGFQPIPLYGEYLDSPLSMCMGKPLHA
jgi:GNAT superfamily N-acetyltransferase